MYSETAVPIQSVPELLLRESEVLRVVRRLVLASSVSNWPRVFRPVGRAAGEPADWARGSGRGAVAQLGERLICIQEVAGSIPTSSTSFASSLAGSGLSQAVLEKSGPVAQVARAHP